MLSGGSVMWCDSSLRFLVRFLAPAALLVGCAQGMDPSQNTTRNPLCDPECIAPEVCSMGVCVGAETDEDGDGVSAALDCDDLDPALGQNATLPCDSDCGAGTERCMGGVWNACTAPTDCACSPTDEPRTVPCERCGEQRQVCIGGVWQDDGACMAMGACEPGETRTGESCADGCGTEIESCTTSCEWGAAACMGACVCGDGTCNGTENRLSCPGDCPASCGDGVCEESETCSDCADDCGACPPSCGDGMCNGAETCSSCAADCGACPASCGDGMCNGGETCSSCAADCGACPEVCGNGTCGAGEDCASCAADCGACIVCGDGTCNGSEDCSTCPGDCGSCGPVCGDGRCESGESCSSCADCQNGHMGNGENGDSCAGVAAETWRCVTTTACAGATSQVCRGGV
ncbi:MAG: hypothetical protein GWO02_09505, partial [Gammaproteobacteria bacterium]|nr:hypothetical protein [Gammaproteobacteria bacterium]